MTTLLLPVLKGTLPGFPSAPEPSLLDSLAVLALIPGVIAIVVTLLIMGPRWLHRSAPAGSQIEARPVLISKPCGKYTAPLADGGWSRALPPAVERVGAVASGSGSPTGRCCR